MLLDIGELRIAASKWDIRSIAVQPPATGYAAWGRTPTGDLIFSFKRDPGHRAKTLFASIQGEVRIPEPKTIRLRLGESYFESGTLVTLLRKILGGNSE